MSAKRAPDLIVIGDLMVDVTVAATALVRGGDVHGDVRLRPAGSGANAAVWAASAGAGVRLYGRIGDDLAGLVVGEALASRGVDVTPVTIDNDEPTGAMLVVREAGERSMVASRGANATLRPDHLPDHLDAGAVLVSGYLLLHERSESAALAAIERARAPIVAVEAASWPLIDAYGRGRFLSSTAGANVLLANEREAEALTGERGEASAGRLRDHYGRAVVKLGSRGGLWADGAGLLHRPSPTVSEVDPTGAGDAFDGVLLAELIAGHVPEVALAAACHAGARAAGSVEVWPER